MSVKFTESVELELRPCGSCGSFIALRPEQWERLEAGKERDDKGSIKGVYCPNGHHRGWWESDGDRQRKRAEAAEAQVKNLRGELAVRDIQIATRDKEAARLRRRTQAGVCSLCRRHFTNMQRHMDTKHGEVQQREVHQ